VGSSFHREGTAYLKERFVIFKEEWVGGRGERVTMAHHINALRTMNMKDNI